MAFVCESRRRLLRPSTLAFRQNVSEPAIRASQPASLLEERPSRLLVAAGSPARVAERLN